MFFAERIDLGANLIANATCSLQAFLVCPREFRRIVEWPMQPSGDCRENRTPSSLGLATNCYYKLKHLSRLPNIENALRCVLGDINSELQKRFHDQWIDGAWF